LREIKFLRRKMDFGRAPQAFFPGARQPFGSQPVSLPDRA
jgi:hypothetical protein